MKTKKLLIVCGVVGVFTCIMKLLIFKRDVFETLYWLIALVSIVPIAWKDYKEHIIPNQYLLWVLRFGIPLFFVNLVVYNEYFISISVNKVLGLLVGGGIFLLAMLISPKGVGAGDVKLYAVIGFLLGSRAIFNVLLYALVLGAVCSIVLLISKKKTRKDELPLAPYTFIGLLLALCLGV